MKNDCWGVTLSIEELLDDVLLFVLLIVAVALRGGRVGLRPLLRAIVAAVCKPIAERLDVNCEYQSDVQ